MFLEFPKWLHAPDGSSVLVDNAAEQLALGEGWYDTPTLAEAAAAAAPDKDALLAKAKELGLSVDGRWGIDRIAQAIAEASLNDAQ